MRTILSYIITADNYTTSIATLLFVIVALYTTAKFLKKRNIIAGLAIICGMTIAAGACLSSIAVSIPYIEADLNAYATDAVNDMIGDWGIDSAMVDLPYTY